MTTAPSITRPAPSTAGAAAYLCSDCTLPTPASEVHDLAGGDVVAYCRQCAHTFRRYAVQVYPVHVAQARRIRVTL